MDPTACGLAYRQAVWIVSPLSSRLLPAARDGRGRSHALLLGPRVCEYTEQCPEAGWGMDATLQHLTPAD